MSTTVRTLLDGAVDYAGLFPPAKLAMRDAVERYASYRSSPHAWMLGRFVVNAARLDEFAEAASPLAQGDAWRISVLSDDAERGAAAMIAFNDAHRWAVCDALETNAASAEGVARIADAMRRIAARTFVEVPIAEDSRVIIDAIGTHGLSAKIRTGGIVEAAIPPAAHIARFLGHCVRANVPFKATAGLHHPLRGAYRLTYDDGSATAVMHGYLNVFLAAALLHQGGNERDAIALLEERDAATLRIDTDGVHWAGRFIAASGIAAFRRTSLAGFGSCSFTEPVDEIVAMGLA